MCGSVILHILIFGGISDIEFFFMYKERLPDFSYELFSILHTCRN